MEMNEAPMNRPRYPPTSAGRVVDWACSMIISPYSRHTHEVGQSLVRKHMLLHFEWTKEEHDRGCISGKRDMSLTLFDLVLLICLTFHLDLLIFLNDWNVKSRASWFGCQLCICTEYQAYNHKSNPSLPHSLLSSMACDWSNVLRVFDNTNEWNDHKPFLFIKVSSMLYRGGPFWLRWCHCKPIFWKALWQTRPWERLF